MSDVNAYTNECSKKSVITSRALRGPVRLSKTLTPSFDTIISGDTGTSLRRRFGNSALMFTGIFRRPKHKRKRLH